MKLLCHIDWLEIYCRRHQPLKQPTSTAHLILKHEDYTTRVYKDVYTITTDYHVPVATATLNPLSAKSSGGILDDCVMHIKIANYWLYTDKWYNWLQQLCILFDCDIVNISRLDLCGDWQYAASGCPAAKVLQFLAVGKYRKVYQPNWAMHAKSKDELQYNSIGFGSKSSPVYTRFYNKTLELLQVKDKPYIRQLWESYGFDKTKDVFRTEFSLTGLGKSCVDPDTGEVLTYTIDHLVNPQGVYDIFIHLAQRYFDIRKYDNERTNRCTPIMIFPKAVKPYIPLQNPRYAESTRVDKMILNRLIKYLDSPDYDEGAVQAILYMIKDTCDNKRLWDWLGINYAGLQRKYIHNYVLQPDPLQDQELPF